MATLFSFHFVLIFILAVIVLVTVDAEIHIINERNETVDSFVDNIILNGGEHIQHGLIVAADPLDACSPIKKAEFPHFENISITRFVLMYGNLNDSCEPNLKVRHASAAHYDVAILVDHVILVDGLPLFISNTYDPDLNITVLSIYPGSAKIIMDNYLYNKSSQIFWIEVTPKEDGTIYALLLFFVEVGLCICMVRFIFLLLFKCVKKIRRNLRNNVSTSEIRQFPIESCSSWEIRQLPTERYTSRSQCDTCAICLEEYKKGEKLRRLPCSHAYHIKCIDQWLLKNCRTCPLCKRNIKFREDDSNNSEVASLGENQPLLPPRSSRVELRSSDLLRLRQLIRSLRHLIESSMVHSNETQRNEASSSISPPCDVFFEPAESVTEEHRNVAHQPNPASTYGSVNNSQGEYSFSAALEPVLQNRQHTYI